MALDFAEPVEGVLESAFHGEVYLGRKGCVNVTSTRMCSDRFFFQKKHPSFETSKRDDHPSEGSQLVPALVNP